MQINPHYDLEGKHSALSASKHSWLRYDKERMQQVWLNEKAKEEGTRKHYVASEMIKLGIKAAPHKKAFNMFVNDAIGFGLASEVVLAYSRNAFATSDAIGIVDGKLRIHDLNTGISKPSFEQLDIYAALFMLEYGYTPEKLPVVERLYQGSGFTEVEPAPEDIQYVMDKIEELDAVITDTATNYFKKEF
jgi:hypothetical protein